MSVDRNSERHTDRGIRLTDVEAAELRKREEIYGIYVVARGIGISKEGAARACARMSLYPATLEAVRRYLRGQARR